VRESPIFIKSFEILEWILAHTRKFPKHQRFVMAKRIEDAALSFHDQLVLATKVSDKAGALREADFHLERLKVYNRLAMRLKLSSFAQYEHLAAALSELGKLLGGWQRSLPKSAPSGGEGAGES
jgi:23S rRNA-intervening sequence protein